MREITRVAYETDLTQPTIRHAEIIYEANEIAREGPGHPDEARQVACLYLAIQEQNEPVSFTDLAEASNVDRNGIYRVSRDIHDRLDIKTEPRDPHDFIDRFVERLNEEEDACLSDETREYAVSLLTQELDRAPVSVAAGAVYLGAQAENKYVTATDMARVANLDPRTVKAAADDLSDKL